MPIEIIRPASDHTIELTPSIPGNNWEMVTNASDSYNVWNSPPNSTVRTDWYAVGDPTFPASAIINSVTVYYRVFTEYPNVANFQPFLYVSSTNWGTGMNHSGAWATYSEVIGRPGGGTWTYADLQNLYMGIAIGLVGTSFIAACSYLYAEVDYALVGGVLFQSNRKKITLGAASIH